MATTPFKLDDTTKYGVVQEAEKRAKASGRTREQELYSYAQSQGVDDAGIDTYMGFDPGTSANFAKGESVRNLASQALAQRNSQPAGIIAGAAAQPPATQNLAITPTATNNQWDNIAGTLRNAAAQAPRPDAGQTPAAGGGGAAATGGNAAAREPFKSTEKSWLITEANRRATANGTDVVAELNKAAIEGGITSEEAERLMGFMPGTLTGKASSSGGAGGAATGGGIIGTAGGTTALGTTPVSGVTPGAKLTDPSTWTTTSDQTVAGQLAKNLDPNNPLRQQARTRALTQANSRGLLNSTIAETGADAAMNDIALQIAQADAAQGSKVAGYNVGAQNQFTMADKAQNFDLAKMDKAAAIALNQMSAEQQNVVARLAIQQGYNLDTMTVNQVNDLAKMGKQVEYQNAQAEVKYGYDRGLVEIQKASNLEIASMESQYRQQIQASASATSIMNQLPTLIARVMENKDTDAAAKQAQINYYVATSTAALKLAGQFAGDVDLSGSLDGILGLTP